MPKNSLAPKLVELMQLFKQLISEQNEGLEKRRVELLYQAIGSQLKKVFLALRKARFV
ncbi:hypothetical protein DPMN_168925 [Dreissena polymorpha]|uniref:Uncharacterized protein n=1 Tax=Dreissena polymorpha TaxID=45954 RepID=A0A9D4F2V9_DREPO|nr:hypothetical protein DPMN_168925 [Dreissena polymorpha]